MCLGVREKEKEWDFVCTFNIIKTTTFLNKKKNTHTHTYKRSSEGKPKGKTYGILTQHNYQPKKKQ